MIYITLDTDVWLKLLHDVYQNKDEIGPFDELMFWLEQGHVKLVLPQNIKTEWERNKESTIQAAKRELKKNFQKRPWALQEPFCPIQLLRSRSIREFRARSSTTNWALKHLVAFSKGKDWKFSDIDETWLMRLKHYLLHEKITSNKNKLSQNSAHSYFNKVKAALRQAYEEKYINENPATRTRSRRIRHLLSQG